MATEAIELTRGRLDHKRMDRTIDEIVRELRGRFGNIGQRTLGRVGRLAKAMAALVDAWNQGQLEPQFEALEIPMPRRGSRISRRLDLFREENIELITKMSTETAGKISEAVDIALRKATRHEDLAKDINRIAKVGSSRAKLIGRDQVLKLYGNLTEIRQTEAGILAYVWNTSLDERVRPEHAELHGTQHYWNNPPYTGTGLNHPGTDYQCRCVAIPILE